MIHTYMHVLMINKDMHKHIYIIHAKSLTPSLTPFSHAYIKNTHLVIDSLVPDLLRELVVCVCMFIITTHPVQPYYEDCP